MKAPPPSPQARVMELINSLEELGVGWHGFRPLLDHWRGITAENRNEDECLVNI